MNETPRQRKEQAAQLIAEGRHEYGEIAEKIGVDVRTLLNWRKGKKFAARVDEVSAELSDHLLKRAIARKEYRISVLNRVQTKLETLIDQRAEELANVPGGGDTGLLVRQYKVSGENVVPEYVFDAAVVRELRAVQEQAAKELGQLVEKHEHKIRSLKDLSEDELVALASELDDTPSATGEDSGGTESSEESQG